MGDEVYIAVISGSPGAVGKRVAREDAARVGAEIAPTGGRGNKAKRAENAIVAVNEGNCMMLHDGGERTKVIDDFLAHTVMGTEREGKALMSVVEATDEMREFREHEQHLHDDFVDSFADAVNELSPSNEPSIFEGW